MKVLLTGAAGQLGQALLACQPPGLTVIPCSRQGGAAALALDLADTAGCRQLVLEHRPDWVLNAGAYTQVDQAEREPDLARAVNAAAPAAFAQALDETGGRLLQISTDFVFNGRQGSPYQPQQQPDPLGVYGATKAEAEAAVLRFPGSLVLRTGWLYGPVGRNFCLTMLRLQREAASEGSSLRVVADQVGCPTSTRTLAAACWRVLALEAGREGAPLLHWSDAGAASWYDFAVAIAELAHGLGLLERIVPVQPITTADYPTAARRPACSLLDCSGTQRRLGLEPQHWRAALIETLRSIVELQAC